MAQAERTEATEHEVRIAATPETVFGFFTDPEKMTRWKGTTAKLDPRPGGIYRVDVVLGTDPVWRPFFRVTD